MSSRLQGGSGCIPTGSPLSCHKAQCRLAQGPMELRPWGMALVVSHHCHKIFPGYPCTAYSCMQESLVLVAVKSTHDGETGSCQELPAEQDAVVCHLQAAVQAPWAAQGALHEWVAAGRLHGQHPTSKPRQAGTSRWHSGMSRHPLIMHAYGAGSQGAAGKADDEPGISGRLLIDCMGNFSPIVRQARWGKRPDGVCLVVGSCCRGFPNNNTGEPPVIGRGFSC